MKLTTFFISITRRIFTNLLAVSESLKEINEIVLYLQNCKYYNVNQDDYKKPYSSRKFFGRSYLKTIGITFKSRTILGYF